MRILLAGATGTLGRPLVRQLIEAGHDVCGITRSPEGADALVRSGASAVIADVLDRQGLARAVRGERFDAVVNELTALKRPPVRHRDMRQTNRLRVSGTQHLIEAARETGATRFVTQSIVFGYGFRDHGTTPLTEDAPFGELHGDPLDEHVEAMASTERQATTTEGIDGVALRYGLLYGADLARVVAMLRTRMVPIVGAAARSRLCTTRTPPQRPWPPWNAAEQARPTTSSTTLP